MTRALHQPLTPALVLALLLGGCALGCGNGEEENNTEPEPEPEPDMRMAEEPDMGEEEEEEEPDMAPTPEGPGDCESSQWFEAQTSSCQACPAPALACASIDREASSIDPATDTVTIVLSTNTTVLQEATLVAEVTAITYGNNLPGGGSVPDEEVTFSTEQEASALSPSLEFGLMPEMRGDELKAINLDEVRITDGCGQEHTISLIGIWDPTGDVVENEFLCLDTGT